jgi:hypothetical protein
VALNELLRAPRVSRDIDLFHDTDEALARTWAVDRAALEGQGFVVDVVRERPTFVEANVSGGGDAVLMQWARDSAFRFFPLVSHDLLGLTLHPFDLATNKVLALVGRVEVRDFIDTLECDHQLQPLGYLCWAACGKDPGFTPQGLLENAARTTRYSAREIRALEFEGEPPDPAVLARRWHAALARAEEVVAALPPKLLGTCVLAADEALFRGDPSALRDAIARGKLRFREGSIGGAVPTFVG